MACNAPGSLWGEPSRSTWWSRHGLGTSYVARAAALASRQPQPLGSAVARREAQTARARPPTSRGTTTSRQGDPVMAIFIDVATAAWLAVTAYGVDAIVRRRDQTAHSRAMALSSALAAQPILQAPRRICTPSLHRLCTASAPPLRCLCATSAPPHATSRSGCSTRCCLRRVRWRCVASPACCAGVIHRGTRAGARRAGRSRCCSPRRRRERRGPPLTACAAHLHRMSSTRAPPMHGCTACVLRVPLPLQARTGADARASPAVFSLDGYAESA